MHDEEQLKGDLRPCLFQEWVHPAPGPHQRQPSNNREKVAKNEEIFRRTKLTHSEGKGSH